VWSNTTAKPHVAGEIAATLTRQLVEPVLFSDSLLDMAAEGIDTFVHVGPGDVTAGLARRTVEGANVLAVSGLDDIRSAIEAVVSIDRP
jgi:[acyl-carrier-protein] S-malonyltransferase